LVAVLTLHLFAWLRLRTLVPRFALGMLLTPAGLSIGAIAVANAAGIDERENFNRPEREACLKTGNYAPLARSPAGLIAADIDFGPFLLALTPHSVLAAASLRARRRGAERQSLGPASGGRRPGLARAGAAGRPVRDLSRQTAILSR